VDSRGRSVELLPEPKPGRPGSGGGVQQIAQPFWMAVVGPFGTINAVESLAVAMVAPVGNPTLDIRNVHLSNDDPAPRCWTSCR